MQCLENIFTYISGPLIKTFIILNKIMMMIIIIIFYLFLIFCSVLILLCTFNRPLRFLLLIFLFFIHASFSQHFFASFQNVFSPPIKRHLSSRVCLLLQCIVPFLLKQALFFTHLKTNRAIFTV